MDKNYFRSNSIEIRIADGGESLIIAGFLPTNQLSHVLFSKERKEFFREKISNGVFGKAIKEKTPLLLLNHSYKAEDKLEIISFDSSESERGLHFTAEVVPNMKLIEAIDNNLINGLSFGFVVDKYGQSWARVNGELIRTINKFFLREISVLFGESNIPAYPQTTAFVDSSKKVVIEKEIHHLKQEINKLRLKEIKSNIEKLKRGV